MQDIINIVADYVQDRESYIIALNIKHKFTKTDRFCEEAIKQNRIDILESAKQSGYPFWDSWICKYAAKAGYLEILQLARENGCSWDSWTCAYAAKGGHLEILKWERDNGCPWGEDN